MMDWTCLPNESNLLHISIYFSFSLAELCITAPCYTKDCETFPPPRDPQSSAQGANFVLCDTVHQERMLLVVLLEVLILSGVKRRRAKQVWCQVWCLALFNCCSPPSPPPTTPPALYLICRLVWAASTQSPWTLIGEGLAGPLVVALRV